VRNSSFPYLHPGSRQGAHSVDGEITRRISLMRYLFLAIAIGLACAPASFAQDKDYF